VVCEIGGKRLRKREGSSKPQEVWDRGGHNTRRRSVLKTPLKDGPWTTYRWIEAWFRSDGRI